VITTRSIHGILPLLTCLTLNSRQLDTLIWLASSRTAILAGALSRICDQSSVAVYVVGRSKSSIGSNSGTSTIGIGRYLEISLTHRRARAGDWPEKFADAGVCTTDFLRKAADANAVQKPTMS
jgi:hypothetical protein